MIDPTTIKHPIDPEQLREIAAYLVGRPKWPMKLAALLYCGEQTVRNWNAGRVRVPGPAVVALQLLTREKAIRDMLS